MRWMAVLVVVLIVASACGGDEDATVSAGAGGQGDVASDALVPGGRLPLAPQPLSPTVRQIDDVVTGATPIDSSRCPTALTVDDLIPPSELDDDTLWRLLEEMLVMQPEAIDVQANWPEVRRVRQVVVDRGAVLAVEFPGADTCAAVLESIDDPDRVVWVGPLDLGPVWGRDDLPLWRWMIRRILDAAADGPSQVWQSIGTGANDVTSLALRAGEEELAEALFARFGPLVSITVGSAPFPADGQTFDFCTELPRSSSPAGIDAVDVRVEDQGWGFQVVATVRNESSSTVHLGIDRTAVLAEPGGSRSVSAFNGAMTAEERGTTAVPAGGSVEVTATLGVDPCAFDGSAYAVPAGAYEAVFSIRLHDAESWEDEPSGQVLVVRGPYEVD